MTNDNPSFFVDVNVSVYAALKDDPRNAAAKAILTNPDAGKLQISPQIIGEFYSTITSSKRVTSPYTPLEALDFLDILVGYNHVDVLPITPRVAFRLMDMLRSTPVKGPQVFDLQIVATMLEHGVTSIVTYNGSDFRDSSEIEVIEPT